MNKKFKGLYFALATMVFWGASMVSSRYAVVNLQMHPYLLSTIRLFVASMVLLLIAGKGAKVGKSLKHPSTWLYSSLQILLNIGVGTALIYVTSTHSTLLQRINIILGFIIGYLFLGKKLSKNDFLGSFIIFLGITLLLSTLEFEQAISGMAAVLFAATCHVLRTIIAEKHPVAKGTETFSDYCRVLAYILLATSATFLFFALIISFVNQTNPTLEVFNFLPSLENLLTKDQLIFATLTGVFLMTPAMYCFFYGAQKAGTTNFLIYTAYLPIVTFILECCADLFGIMQAPTITYKEVLSALFIMGGALYITYFRNNKKKRSQKLAPKARRDLDVLRDTIKTTYICFNDDSKKVAKTLGYSEKTLSNIMRLDKPVPKTTRNKIVMNHARHVSSLDILTGALNRNSLDLRLKDLKNRDKALVAFIDLDKFKPINDTYGHEAGDSLLKGIAERLMDEFSAPHVVARLGGDEYSLIIYGVEQKDEMKYAAKIKNIVTSPFIVEGFKEDISVGCSVGVAHYPTEGTSGTKLHKIADERMYVDKQQNGAGR